jgi:hypothetical protein
MLSTHQIRTLATGIIEERVEERRFDRQLRNKRAKEAAQRNLRREIERLLKADGSVQSVLDVLETVAAKSKVQVGREAKTACCS